MPAKPVSLVLRLPPRLHALAKKRARHETRSLNSLVVVALMAYLKKGA